MVFLAGVLSHFGYLQLPATLAVLQHPLVMAAAGTMALAELVADKIPASTRWGQFPDLHPHSGRRLAGRLAMGEVDPAWAVAAGLVGGTITAGTHFAIVGGSRLAINASPEPFSNWLASFSEEGGMVLGGFGPCLPSPVVFLRAAGALPFRCRHRAGQAWGFVGRLLRRV